VKLIKQPLRLRGTYKHMNDVIDDYKDHEGCVV